MSNLSTEQLEELTLLVNRRRDEFGPGVLEPLSPGEIRMMHDVLEQWWMEDDLPAAQPTGMPHDEDLLQDIYHAGFAHGKTSAPPEPDPDRLVTHVAQEPESPLGPNGNGNHLSEHVIVPRAMVDRLVAGVVEHMEIAPPANADPVPDPPLEAVPAIVAGQADESERVMIPDTAPKLATAPKVTDARRIQLEARQAAARREKEKRERERDKLAAPPPSRDEMVAELQRQAMAGVMPSQAQFNLAKPATWATATAHCLRLEMSWEDLAKAAGLKPNPRVGQPTP